MGDDGGCYHIMIWLICRLGIFRICTFKVQGFWCYVRQNMMGMGWGIFQNRCHLADSVQVQVMHLHP